MARPYRGADAPQTDLTLDELVPVVIGERSVGERRGGMKNVVLEQNSQ